MGKSKHIHTLVVSKAGCAVSGELFVLTKSRGHSPSPAKKHTSIQLLSTPGLPFSALPMNSDLCAWEEQSSSQPLHSCQAPGEEQRDSPLQLPEGWGKRRAGAWLSDGDTWPKSCPPARSRHQLQPNKGPINLAHVVGFSASVHLTEGILLRNFHLRFAKVSPRRIVI